ncbi:MAG: cell division protein ZapA [Clostridiales bacterium]|nr:cell division protein ZapA [Clostridiales bacterium]
MSTKNKVIIRIGGREYAIRGNEPEEYIHKVAVHVDKKMNEISAKQPPLSISMLSILTALNLADDLIKCKEQIERLQRELKEAKKIAADTKIESMNVYDIPKKTRG